MARDEEAAKEDEEKWRGERSATMEHAAGGWISRGYAAVYINLAPTIHIQVGIHTLSEAVRLVEWIDRHYGCRTEAGELPEVEGMCAALRDPWVSRMPRARTTAGNRVRDPGRWRGTGKIHEAMRGYSDRMNGEGKDGSRCTFHGDVTSYSGTRAACNERFRNYSSAVYRRRAFVRSQEKFYTATIRAYPSVHRARFGHREFVATFVSKIATDEEECLRSEEIFVREMSLEDFLGKDIVKAFVTK